ncbi:Calx-beta domain-containing protein [Chloroflexus sp.]|uniref:Calx-beta domain-containing protein n=1 Tax=Chloroflexus sp. TaxID=1904827 RepID=UPI002ACEB902|nr:Calx-beta domain-containing protein [Chloroflexus sp.]
MQSLGNSQWPTKRDYLRWMVVTALVCALLPVVCEVQLVFWFLTPANEPFKSISAARAFSAYEPFPADLSFAPPASDLPNLAATEIARRTQTPTSQATRFSPAAIVEVPPPPVRIDPASPTATPALVSTATPPPAGGGLPPLTPTPTPTASGIGVLPSPATLATATPATIPTVTPAAPAAQPSPTPTTLAATATLQPSPSVTVIPSPTATVRLQTTETPTLTPLPTETPTLTPTPVAVVSVQVIQPVIEGNPPTVTTRDVVVELREAAYNEVVVTYEVVPGTTNPATPDRDYRVPGGTTGTLIFSAGSPAGTVRTVTIEVNSDTIDEEDETIIFRLTGISGGILFPGQSERVLTIIDDDVTRVIISPAEVQEGPAGTTTQLEFNLSLSNMQRERTLRVRYRVLPISATPGEDYLATTPGELVIPPDDNSPVIIVTVIGDDIREPDEFLEVVPDEVIGGALGNTVQAIGIIRNDD